jgi:hypothetical protein
MRIILVAHMQTYLFSNPHLLFACAHSLAFHFDLEQRHSDAPKHCKHYPMIPLLFLSSQDRESD